MTATTTATLKLRLSQIVNREIAFTEPGYDMKADIFTVELRKGMIVDVTERTALAGAPGYRRGTDNTTYRLLIVEDGQEPRTGHAGTFDNIAIDNIGRFEIVGRSTTHLHLREVEA